jgi:predicted extracellular nuclease
MRPRRILIAATAVVTAAVTAIAALALTQTPASAAPSELLLSEYVEGSSNNKAIEIYNGTGAAVNLATSAYALETYSNGNPVAGLTINLTGTVADGDVYVVAHSSASAAILAQADQTTNAGWFNGNDAVVLRKGGASGAVIDSIGQVGFDPGSQWGSGLTSTMDNTLRRKTTIEAGDTNPNDIFDPAVEWDGFANDTFDGLGTHSTEANPVTVTCGPALTTSAGTAAVRTVTATDADDIVVNLDVTAVNPAPAAGSIARTALTPATEAGGTASAEITVDAAVPSGSYAVTVTSTDADGGTGSCLLTVTVTTVLTVGEVQGQTTDTENGKTDRSPLAPATGNGSSSTLYDVRGVITQKTMARSSAGVIQHGFFLQSRVGATDGDPLTSDGVFVFMGSFTTLVGGYAPTVGDEVVLRARVSEFFSMTQLTGASLVRTLASGLDVNSAVEVANAVPPASLAAADRFWERHEGARLRVRAGSSATSGRDVFPSTADSEIWLVDVDDPLLDRADPHARRVFRDPHPLDNNPTPLFDDGNGARIMLASLGVKAVANDSFLLLPPARVFDTLSSDAVGGLYFSFDKYGVQAEAVAFTPGVDPSTNAAPSAFNRNEEYSVATFNVENLYDFRDDPFDGCDFAGNNECPGVTPPFDYVPASDEEYRARLAAEAAVVVGPMRSPDIMTIEEAEDQDICTVSGGALVCGTTNNADGKPDTVQELALAIAAAGGPTYDAAYDRNGADARGIIVAFLYRTDRVSLAPAGTGVLSATPGVEYRAPALPYNADVQNPKSFNAELPDDVDTSTGVDGSNVYTRAPLVGKFLVASAPGSSEALTLWVIGNHFSSTPNARVGQRREQAGYGAAIVTAIEAHDASARIAYGGDLNVFPRPDDPIAQSDSDTPSDQLAPLYDAGLRNLWEDLLADAPSAAYSYVFQGQAQTLDHIFVNETLYGDLVRMRAAHVNAGWPADHAGDGPRGVSDHDPQIARFRSRAALTVADVSVGEGNSGTTPATFAVRVSRPLSQPVFVCAATLGITASDGSDYNGIAGCKTLAPGATSLTFTVNVRGDRRREPNEQFALLVLGAPYVQLADPIAVGTITNDD